MAMERSKAPALPLPALLSASSASPSTVGALLTKASVAAATGGGARECPSPRSLLSRILHRAAGGGGGGGGGFGCRLRLPWYCSNGAAKEDAAGEDAAKEEARGAAAPKVVGSQAEVRESPRSSLGKKAAAEVSLASLGMGASLVLLLSKGAAELGRMAELRTQMERLVLDVKAETRSSNRSNASDQTDSASVVKEPIACVQEEDDALSRGSRTAASARSGGNAGRRAAVAMDQMEAELEAELTRLQFTSNNEECAIPRRDHQLQTEAKSDATSVSHSPTCVDNDGSKEDEDDDDDGEEERGEGESPPHGGVSARELERRLHELLQSRHEERIAELETALERAQRKLQEKEREVCWWRDTAKLVTRHKDESRLR